MGQHVIFGVHITNRLRDVAKIQQVFTEYGCNIKTRLGLHDVQKNYCSPSGLIVLDMIGELSTCNEMKLKLAGIEGVEVKEMFFAEHD